jgi:plastocyanin
VVLAAAIASAVLAAPVAAKPTTATVYAAGLFNPKVMAFGPDGSLYVAESGPPGNVTVPLPVNFGGSGPIGRRAAIAKIAPNGGRAQQWLAGLPNIGLYGGVEMLGAAAVAFHGGRLYEVAAGHMTVSPKLSWVAPGRKLHTVTDVGEFNNDHPPPPQNGDAVPGGNPYDLVSLGKKLYISDGNYNRVLEADPLTGGLRILATFYPGPVTVGMAVAPDQKEIYVAQYGNAPYLPGSGYITAVTPEGKVRKAVTGLTTPIDMAFGKDGTLYVLQYAARFDSKHLRYVANTGSLLRIDKDGTKHELLTKLMFPTALTIGPDGAIYLSDFGNESNFGEGVILRVVPGDSAIVAPAVPLPKVHGTYDIPKSNETLGPGANVAGAVKVDIVEPKAVLKWGYSPKVIHAKVGQKVVFTNTGLISHTATSKTGAFDTGLIKHNRSAIVVLNKPGSYALICTPHPWMKATILVSGKSGSGSQAAAIPVATGKSPSVDPLVVVLVVGGIIVGVFALAWFTRRRNGEKAEA